MKFDTIIVGSGFSGSVIAERLASIRNEKVLIIEKRNHVGGNAFDYYDENGILVHKYGSHTFHTNSKKAWDYLSEYTAWRLYNFKVLADIDGIKAPLPFNLNSAQALFPPTLCDKIEKKLIDTFGFGKKVTILELMKTKDPDLKFLADFVYKKVFLNYTIKQWGFKPEELSPEVTGRVPIHISGDDRYFHDTYQGLPESGYTKMFERILSHPNIKILLNTDYKGVISEINYDKLIVTSEIDRYFDFKFGYLPYRTLDFEWIFLNREYFQETAMVNYPNCYDFTRITEFKHLTGQVSPRTTIIKEYPRLRRDEKEIPYYPVPKDEYIEIYKKYEAEAKKLKNTYFLGRLGRYSYINMDEAVLNSLEFFENIA